MPDDDVPLREHVEAMLAAMDLRYQQRFDAQTKAVDAALLAAEKAVTKAEAASERRFEGVNEFRQTLSDQATTFVTRAEHDALKERIGDLAEQNRTAAGHSAGLRAAWGYLLGVAGLIVAVVAVLVTR